MKKKRNILQNLALIFTILTMFIACDKDFANIDSDVVNADNAANFNTIDTAYSIITYNKKVPAFQSNGLPAIFFGHYNDEILGTTTTNFVSQMVPSELDPTFGDNVVVDSVVLTIPYFSTPTANNADGTSTFKLDSVYGKMNDDDDDDDDTYYPINFSVYQNNYFLRSFNPDSDFDENQKYYSNGTDGNTSLINLEGEKLFETTSEFTPSNEQIKLVFLDNDGERDSTFVNPSLRVHLDAVGEDYWKTLIFDKEGEPELSNQNNFKDYFRGLYFKAETAAGADPDGSLMLLNPSASESNVVIFYKHDKVDDDDDGDDIPNYADVDSGGTDTDGDGINDENDVDQTGGTDDNGNGIDDTLDITKREYALNFSGNIVNIVNNNFTTTPTIDEINGDEKLYLKGNEGYMTVINLFDGDAVQLTNFKDQFREDNNGVITFKRLVNEAYLDFYVDQSTVLGQREPDRIYLYDLKNNLPIIDYFVDQSTNVNTGESHLSHLRPLERDDDGNGVRYRVRITDHINNIILRDSTNVKLGLTVVSNVTAALAVGIIQTDALETIPLGAVQTPLSTVLFGNNTADEDKKAKLTIYFTEPDTDN